MAWGAGRLALRIVRRRTVPCSVGQPVTRHPPRHAAPLLGGCVAVGLQQVGHVVAVLHKLTRVGTGGDARDLPDVIDGIADDGWASSFTRARMEVERVWADDEELDRMVALPWATLPGREALEAYTHEFTAHSWDLHIQPGGSPNSTLTLPHRYSRRSRGSRRQRAAVSRVRSVRSYRFRMTPAPTPGWPPIWDADHRQLHLSHGRACRKRGRRFGLGAGPRSRKVAAAGGGAWGVLGPVWLRSSSGVAAVTEGSRPDLTLPRSGRSSGESGCGRTPRACGRRLWAPTAGPGMWCRCGRRRGP